LCNLQNAYYSLRHIVKISAYRIQAFLMIKRSFCRISQGKCLYRRLNRARGVLRQWLALMSRNYQVNDPKVEPISTVPWFFLDE
jgi:hypothetical protein